jgi:RNA polymerase sigma-70 factor (ECF subfamily)
MLLQESPVDVVKKATLGKWYVEYGPKLLAMLKSRLDPRAAGRRQAEDILHNAFVKAEKSWDRFAESGMTPYAWLYRLVLDCICDDHDYQNAQPRRVRREQDWPDSSSQQMVLGLFSTGGSPSKAIDQDERLQQLKVRMAETLALLSTKDHEILCMRHYDELEPKEIAQVLGIKEGTARVRYARARARLLELWVERYGEEDLQA